MRVLSLPQRRIGDQCAELRHAAAGQRFAQQLANQPRSAFAGFQRDIAGETVRHDHVHGALGNIVAFDEALKFQIDAGLANELRRGANFLVALLLFCADIEQRDARPLLAGHGALKRFAHDGEFDQLFGVGFDVGADIEHHCVAALHASASASPERGDARLPSCAGETWRSP